MTVENSKKLYKHYLEIKRFDAAKNILDKYPEFEKKEQKEKSKKS